MVCLKFILHAHLKFALFPPRPGLHPGDNAAFRKREHPSETDLAD
jgi:hypothetical protein